MEEVAWSEVVEEVGGVEEVKEVEEVEVVEEVEQMTWLARSRLRSKISSTPVLCLRLRPSLPTGVGKWSACSA